MPKPLTDADKLDRFFRSQGVPKFSRDAQLEMLSDANKKAIVAGVGDDGVVTRAAVDAFEQARDAHRVKVREAEEKAAAEKEATKAAEAKPTDDATEPKKAAVKSRAKAAAPPADPHLTSPS